MNARAEFTRIQRARERLAPDDPADSKLARREAELLRAHRDDWQVNDFRDVFRDGTVVEVTLQAYREKPTLSGPVKARGRSASPSHQLAVLRRCIAGFNRFSDSLHTIEAEDIMTTFDQLVRYTKYAGEEDLADRWRDF